jgi:outer membrane protein insertion porin family
MRLSPVLLAIFTASAILGQAFTARSQTLEADREISIDLDLDLEVNDLQKGEDLPSTNHMVNQIAFASHINQPVDDLLNDLEMVDQTDQTIDKQPINKVNKSLVNQENLAFNSPVQIIEPLAKQNIVKKFDPHPDKIVVNKFVVNKFTDQVVSENSENTVEKIATNKFASNNQAQINTYQSNWLKKYNIAETAGKFSETSLAQSPDISQAPPPPPPPPPEFPGDMPATPELEQPSLPSTPEVPNIPTTPELQQPSLPSTPEVPNIPTTPQLQQPSLPTTPSLPTETPEFPNIPTEPELKVPSSPTTEEIPGTITAPATTPATTPTNTETNTEPTPPTTTTPAQPDTRENEPLVLVAEVVVEGVEGELKDQVYQVISTTPGKTTTRSQLQRDINAIFATGFFRNVQATPEDTALGVRVVFKVDANPALKAVVVEGQTVLPASIVEQAFTEEYGKPLNLRAFQQGVEKINKWYQENGYILGQVVGAPQIADDGTVTIRVAEGKLAEIRVRFLNKEGEDTHEDGNAVKGRTREFIITREVELQPGDIFNRPMAERDIKRVFDLGLFEDVNLGLEPVADNPSEAVMIINVIEKNTGSFALGGGFSSASGLFGTVSYQQQNLGGNDQNLTLEVQAGQRILLGDISFTDPWIAGDKKRTSYTLNLFKRRSISIVFDGGDREVDLPNGDNPRVIRTGGGISFTRPLIDNPFEVPVWTASVGLQYQYVQIQDADGDTVTRDELGNRLSVSNSGEDSVLTAQFGMVQDNRNNKLNPTSGTLLRFGVEQAIPAGSGDVFYTALRANASLYLPVSWTKFAVGPQTLAFNLQLGQAIGGNFPPYEAFPLGGLNSIRGYGEGEAGAGRALVVGSIEYRFPMFSFLGGVLFVDAGTVFEQGAVIGNPGGVREKPGSGIGFGIGARIQSPLGPLRIDYGFNDEGDSRIHFGIGERF